MKRWALAGLLFLAGCGGVGSASGSVGGNSLSVKDGFGAAQTDSTGTAVVIALTDVSGVCSQAQGNHKLKSGTAVEMTLGVLGSDGKLGAPAKGDYKIISLQSLFTQGSTPPTGNVAFVTFVKADASCSDTSKEADSGTITVTSIDAKGNASGTYNATFGSDKLTGAFDVTACSLPPEPDGGSTATCS
jgi:hypothetical protein